MSLRVDDISHPFPLPLDYERVRLDAAKVPAAHVVAVGGGGVDGAPVPGRRVGDSLVAAGRRGGEGGDRHVGRGRVADHPRHGLV